MKTVTFYVNPETDDVICQTLNFDRTTFMAHNNGLIAIKTRAGNHWSGAHGHIPHRGSVHVYRIVEREEHATLFPKYPLKFVCEWVDAFGPALEIPLTKPKRIAEDG